MGKLWDLMTIERQEIGTIESPKGSNDIKYNRAYWGELQSYVDLPWCVVFQWWACKQVGVPFPNTAHCNGVESYAKERGQWVSGSYNVGDFVIFDYDGDGSRDHIGFIVSVEADYCITTEGNYADQVASVKRKYSEFVGAYRPDWKALDGEEDESNIPPVSEADSPPCNNGGLDESDSSPYHKGSLDEEGDKGSLIEVGEGDVGQAVMSLQCLLKYVHGATMSESFYPDGRPDGEFGNDTARALWLVTGKRRVDAEVWRELIGELG